MNPFHKYSRVARRRSGSRRKAKLEEESELYAHQIKIDAQTLLGEFLKQMVKAKGGAETGVGRRGKQCAAKTEVHSAQPTLSEHGISHRLSSESQALHTAKVRAPEVHAQVRAKALPGTVRSVADAADRKTKESLPEKHKPQGPKPRLPFACD